MLSTKDKCWLHISSYMMRTQLTRYIQELQHSLTQRKELHSATGIATQSQFVPNAPKRTQLPFQRLLHHLPLPWKELHLEIKILDPKPNQLLTSIFIQTQYFLFLLLLFFFYCLFRLKAHGIYPERLFIPYGIGNKYLK